MRAHGLRMKVSSWEKTLKETKMGKVKNAELREELATRLRELARRAEKLAERLG